MVAQVVLVHLDEVRVLAALRPVSGLAHGPDPGGGYALLLRLSRAGGPGGRPALRRPGPGLHAHAQGLAGIQL